MKVQVLLSCMNQVDHSIVKRANLQTEAIIVNQSDRFSKEEFSNNGSKITFLTFDERGIGLSRNNALMRADADIVLFADDDMEFVDGYEAIVADEFRKNSKADMLVFNVPSKNPARKSAAITKRGRVHLHNCLKYGTVRMAIKLERLHEKGIYFSLLFGGGAKHGSGEDSRLIFQIIQSGLRVYSVPRTIGFVAQEDSSWFEGYTKKYFVDKGVLYRSLSPRLHPLFSARYLIKHHKTFGDKFTFGQLLRFMILDSKKS